MEDKVLLEIEQIADQAGLPAEVAENFKNGSMPMDLTRIQLGFPPEKIFELIHEVEKISDAVVYGVLGINYNQDPALALYLLHNNPAERRYPLDLLDGKYPLCYIADLKNPEKSTAAYLGMTDGRITVFQDQSL